MKTIILFIPGIIILLGGFYVKRTFYDPKYKAKNIGKELKALQEKDNIKDGDIIFQISLSAQSRAIQKATESKYSHCGIIYKNDDKYYVYEAVQPVKLTLLDKWILRGKDGHYVIKRLKDANKILTTSNLVKMRQEGEKFKGRNYDLTFEWSDNKIYCSELIWKIYKRATGMEVGKLQKLGDFDLTDKEVTQKLKERYGDKIPLDEIVISPAAIFDSKLLETVASN